jgi:PilZ domain
MSVVKRRVDRKVQRFPVRLSLHELNSQSVPDSYLVDVSSLGAQLETPHFSALNSPLEFVVRFPWSEKETKLSGLVKWIKPLIGKPGRFRLGLHFFSAFWELDMLARQGKL